MGLDRPPSAARTRQEAGRCALLDPLAGTWTCVAEDTEPPGSARRGEHGRGKLSALVLAVAAAASGSAQGPPAQSAAGPPPFTTYRYDEDWSYLRDERARTGEWWEAFKLVPLDEDVNLSLGAELRSKYEAYVNDLWGGAADDDHDYVWLRALPCADLRAGRSFRLFTQLIAAFELGDEAGTSPIDEDRLDLLQGFADLRFPVEGGALTLRGGRQVLAYGSERLISTRYGPNVMQAFDAAKAYFEGAGWRLDLLGGRPVRPGLGVFDDATNDDKTTWAAYSTLGSRRLGLDAYYIGYQNEQAAFNQGAGHETRHTFGTRFFGNDGAWDWNFELFGQFGSFAGNPVRAWSIASDSGYTFRETPLTPRLGLKADVISGDDDPSDGRLQTFNPLFPHGKYFGEIGLLGPYNLIDLHPTLDLALSQQWGLGISTVHYWRESTGDGIYDNAGNLLRADGGSGARYIGTQLDAWLTFRPHRTLDATLIYSTFLPGRFIADTGPNETTHFASVEVRFRF